MATVSKSFTVVGNGTVFALKAEDSFTYSVSGTFVATLIIERSDNGGTTWSQVGSSIATADSGTLVAQGAKNQNLQYRFQCTAFTSGTAVTALADAASPKVIHEHKDAYGNSILKVTEGGMTIGSGKSATIPTLSAAALTPTAISGSPTTDSGIGAKNGATVSVTETGNAIIHQSVITLTSTVVEVTSVTTGAGVGGTKIYDLPEGRIMFLGCVSDLSLAVAAVEQEFFTDGTPEGDIGIGTVTPANADALGTDATDDDFGTATAFNMTDFAVDVDVSSEAASQFDGTSTAKDVCVNVLVDAGDIDDDATGDIEVSGTVTLTWINLGTFA